MIVWGQKEQKRKRKTRGKIMRQSMGQEKSGRKMNRPNRKFIFLPLKKKKKKKKKNVFVQMVKGKNTNF